MMIGLDPIVKPLVDNYIDSSILPIYAQFEVKRITKANSFMVLDEVFYIAKKKPDGKADSVLYHVYRMSDMRYVCPSYRDKASTIEMVQRKYHEYD